MKNDDEFSKLEGKAKLVPIKYSSRKCNKFQKSFLATRVFSPKFSLFVTGMELDFLIKEIDAWPRETLRPRGKSLKFLLGGIFWSLKLQMKIKKTEKEWQFSHVSICAFSRRTKIELRDVLC